ncbi:MAG: leucine-rich repeat domain-containing protein, partial [Saprospiraceae bacterium]
FQQVVNHITIRNANWRQLPPVLAQFGNLFELSLVHCPYLNLQTINDQLKALAPEQPLYRKFHEEIISLTFSDTGMDSLPAFSLEKELLGDLRELRFIRVKQLDGHCENLLAQLHSAYPNLGWLTMEACGLDDQLNLDTLRSFENLQMVSLANNFLTAVPLVNKNLKSLDLSRNLIRNLRPTEQENKLKFLFLDCNLFQYFDLYPLAADTLVPYPRLDVLTYECNNVLDTNLQRLSAAFDRARVANFLTYTRRYANDFNPARPNCDSCRAYRDRFVTQLLTSVQFSTSNQPCQLEFDPHRQRIVWTCYANGLDQGYTSKVMYTCQNIAECNHISGTAPADPWVWEVTFLVESIEGLKSQAKYLVAHLQGSTGTITEEDVKASSPQR